ncbi:transient receptor potential cation channel subfamily A member 1-like [Babylonia areolata]|uniref:transient receptor potential cation channel subfamily A member 1-like n=1 Tax=Babylonia areolata TaxID=304850 RepID=UPI003FD27CC5
MASPTRDSDERQLVKLLGCDSDFEPIIAYVPQQGPHRHTHHHHSPGPPKGSRPRYRWGMMKKVRRMGRQVRQLSKLSKMKSGSTEVEEEGEADVCLLEDSPFRMLKEAGRGNLEGLMKAYRADPSRLTVQNTDGQTPLHVASANGHLDIVHFLIKQNADLDVADNGGDTPLHTAVRHEQSRVVEVLLQAGADHTLFNEQQMAPLHLACDLGYVDVVKVFAKDPDVDKNLEGEMGMRPLHYCSFKDNAECAVILIENGALPCTRCDQGFFPIHVAAKSAAAKTLEVLIQEGMKVGYERSRLLTFKDKENNMPLHAAVIGGNLKAVEVCLRAGAPVDTQQDDQSTPVHFAAAQGSLTMMQLMYTLQTENFVSALYMKDANSMTPLHRAALFNHKDVLLYLLDKGADINSRNDRECTPLLVAAAKGSWDTVQVLVGSGADVHVRDVHDRNFLHLAIRHGGNLEQFFMKRTGSGLPDENLNARTATDQEQAKDTDTDTDTGNNTHQQPPPPPPTPTTPKHYKNPLGGSYALGCRRMRDLQLLLDEKDEYGCTPLHYASKAGHLKALEELIKLGASPSLKDNAKQSPFHFAARYGRYNTCRRLLDLGQGPNIMNETDSDGLTALHIAAQNGHTKIITLLMQRGAVIHRDNEDNTPLHHAASQGWTQSMRTLLAIHSHLIDVKNSNGETALHVASRQGMTRAVTLLLTMGAALEKDKDDKTFFDYIIELKICEVAMAVVRHNRWEEVLMTPSTPYCSPFLGMIEHMPHCCEAVLDRCQVSSPHDTSSPDYYVEYNFKFMNCPIECIAEAKKRDDFQPLMTLNAMVRYGRVNCLSHPVCVKFLRLKWCSYGLWFYTLILGIYALYLSSLTYFVVENNSLRHHDRGHVNNETRQMLGGNSEKLDGMGTMSRCTVWVVAVFSVLSMVKEVLQMFTQGVRYLWDTQNYHEWTLYITSLMFSAPFLFNYSLHWQWEAGALAVFLAWFNFLVMLQRFDFFGIYVVMFLEILRTLVQALSVFSVLIVAFGLAFYILLHHEDTHAYATPGLSLLRTAMMMLELDFLSSFNGPYTDGDSTTLHFRGLTFFMIVVFVLLMPILLMNLLIGLAVGDIEAVQRNARLKRLAGQVEVHTHMEGKMPLFLLARLDHSFHRHYPNKCRGRLLNFWSRIKLMGDREEMVEVMQDKQSKEVYEELLKQKFKIKEMGTTLDKNNQLLRLIMQKMEIQSEDDAWDEGMKSDRSTMPACLPVIADSPPALRSTNTNKSNNTTTSTNNTTSGSNSQTPVGRSLLRKSAIVSYMKRNQDKN